MSGTEFRSCGLSGLFLGLHFACWITSVQWTSIASATILCATQPLFVSFLGWLILREPLTKLDIVALTLSFLGIIVIGNGDFQIGRTAIIGDAFALLAGLLAAAYFLMGRNVRKSVNLTNYVTVVYSVATVCLAMLSICMRNSFLTYSPNTYFWMFMLALVCTIIGHSLFNFSLKYLSAHKVGMTIFAEPVGAIILAYFIFHEIPALTIYVGGIMILIGLYLALKPAKIDPESTEILT